MAVYKFPHSAPLEEKRLLLMSAMLDPYTLFRIEQLGLAKGWHCLEVGAGNGSISRALAERVGERGRVVALDIDTQLLDSAPTNNLDIRRADILEVPLETEAFDLVYTRALLHHLPQWARVLEKMATALKPGGAMLVQETDMHPAEALDGGDWRDFWIGFRDWAAAEGIDHRLGRKIAPRMQEMGFEHVQSVAETVHFAGGSEPALFYKISMLALQDQLVGSGYVSGDLFERFIKLLDEPGHWGMCISFVATSGIKPAP